MLESEILRKVNNGKPRLRLLTLFGNITFQSRSLKSKLFIVQCPSFSLNFFASGCDFLEGSEKQHTVHLLGTFPVKNSGFIA